MKNVKCSKKRFLVGPGFQRAAGQQAKQTKQVRTTPGSDENKKQTQNNK